MPSVERFSVPGTLSGVREAILAFERFGRAHGVSDAAAWRIPLALDEILSNIVRHPAGEGRDPIDLTFSVDDDMVAVEIVDATAPFNPLLAPPPETSSPLDRRQPGGLGIALVRQLMDETLYERRGNRNHFVMRYGAHGDR